MSVLIRARSRISDIVLRRCNRRFCSYSRAASNEPIVSASTVHNNQPPIVDPPLPSQAPPKKSRGFLTYTLLAALTGGAAATGYATYAYTVDEIAEKTKFVRDWEYYAPIKDADNSTFDKVRGVVYSYASTVPSTLVDIYLGTRRFAEDQIRGFVEPSSDKLLPDLIPEEQHVYTVVLDLNETLISTDWNRERGWRTMKRPGVDALLDQICRYHEIVLFTDLARLSVDPIMERLDPTGRIRYRLTKVDTRYINGKHYRDFSKLNRNPAKIIYVSGHALEGTLQPENSVQIKPWTGEEDDTALVDLIPFLESIARMRPDDIRPVIASYEGRDISKEFIERSKANYRRQLEQTTPRGLFSFLWRRRE